MKKYLFAVIFVLMISFAGAFLIFNLSPNEKKSEPKKQLTIDEVLEEDSYKNLSFNAKEFIKEYYEETGEILLTKDLAKPGEEYLNPDYIEYLDSDTKENYYLVPSITVYDSTKLVNKGLASLGNGEVYPSSYDLRNVDGKNYVTPNKNQGSEGLCWAYSTASLLETHDLMTKDKNYDSDSVLISEKQMDYALSDNGITGGNKIYTKYNVLLKRNLATGGYLEDVQKLMMLKLGGYQNTWNTEYNDIISKNGLLEPYKVYDSSKALYEVDESPIFYNLNLKPDDEEYNEALKNTLKSYIYNNGGFLVAVRVQLSTTFVGAYSNILLNENFDSLIVTNPNYLPTGTANKGAHALHVVGWDDDYEYSFCFADIGGSYGRIITDVPLNDPNHECKTYYYNGITYDYKKISGKGAWILKNSWGSNRSYLYLPYDSEISKIIAFTKYSETKNWDISSELRIISQWNNDKFVYKNYIDNKQIYGDKAIKIKLIDNSENDIALYYNEDCSTDTNLVLVGNYSFDFGGVKTIDLSDKNINLKENACFQTDRRMEMILFTKNSDNTQKASTEDYTYSSKTAPLTNGQSLPIDLLTNVRNIDSGKVINYKIKTQEGEYLPDTAFSYTSSTTYYNMSSPVLSLNKEYAKKGNYILEIWSDNQLLGSGKIELLDDYVFLEGDGTNANPWQITNAKEFNMIRNSPEDSFILMNDIDFEYDVQNINGELNNYGDGFERIDLFKGNLNGNGKTIKNIYAPNGLFLNITASRCNIGECGIHDLTVDNLTRKMNSTKVGGIVDYISLYNPRYFNFNNLSLINSHFIIDKNSYITVNSYEENVIGGIVGKIYLEKTEEGLYILKIDNWYSDFKVESSEEPNYQSGDVYIGGLIGYLQPTVASNISTNQEVISINGAKVNLIYDIKNNNKINYYIADLIGTVNNISKTVKINHTIGNVMNNGETSEKIKTNAYIFQYPYYEEPRIHINGSKSTLSLILREDFKTINYENCSAGLKSYQLANNDYNDYTYYEEANRIYYREGESGHATSVNFKDKFNLYSNKIPTLNMFNEAYSNYITETVIDKGESISINDLIQTDTGHHNIKVYGSYNCDLAVCSTVTNTAIITIPDEANGYTITGLKPGTTNLIIYDEISGYLNTIKVKVLGKIDSLSSILENNGFIINNELTTGFTLGQSIEQIRNLLGDDVAINTKNEIIATGTVLSKDDEKFTVVIKGDLTGDGKINSADLLRMRQYLLGDANLSIEYKTAGMIAGYNDIKSADLLRLRQHLLGQYVIK